MEVQALGLYSHTPLSLLPTFSKVGLGGVAGGITQSTPLSPFSRWLQVFILTWVVHVYSCPGLAFFCLPIDTAPTWHLLPPPLPRCFGLAFLSVCSASGLPAGTRLVVWVGLFLPLLGATVRTRTRRIPFRLRLARFMPSCGFGIFSPPLGFRPLVARSLPRSPGFVLGSRFLWPPRGMPETPNFMPSSLALVAYFGVVCGGMVGLVRSPVVRGAHAAIATVSSSFLIGFFLSRVGFFCGGGCARWLSGCGSDYFFGCVGWLYPVMLSAELGMVVSRPSWFSCVGHVIVSLRGLVFGCLMCPDG